MDTIPPVSGGVTRELIMMLNHDSVSHPRARSTSIVPATEPRSRIIPMALGPRVGRISPCIETNAHSPPWVSESNRKVKYSLPDS